MLLKCCNQYVSKSGKLSSGHVLYLVTQSCPTVCDPMGCSLTGSFVHGDSPGKNIGVGCHAHLQGIFPIQWSLQPRDQAQVSCIAGFFTIWATREAQQWSQDRNILVFIPILKMGNAKGTFRRTMWDSKRQRNHRLNCYHLLNYRESKEVPEKYLLVLLTMLKPLIDHNKLEKILMRWEYQITYLSSEKPLCGSRSNS